MSDPSGPPLSWDDCLPDGKLPARRHESYGPDRVVPCFVERPATVHELLRLALASNPHADAIIDGDLRIDYRTLDARVARLAAGLRQLGVGAGDRVVLLCGNRAETIVAFFAIQRLAAIAVPVSPRERVEGLAFVVAQCGARVVVVDDGLSDRLWSRPLTLTDFETPVPPPVAVRMPPYGGAVTHREVGSWPDGTVSWESLLEVGEVTEAHPCAEQDPAVLLYTSGTTGRPKGAMLTHLGIVHSAEHFRVCMGLGRGARIALAVPASHVTGLVAIIATAVHCAGAVLSMREFKAAAFIGMAARERMQAAILVPAMYRLCLMSPGFDDADLSAWRIGGYGGAPMPESTIDELARRLPGLGLMNAYGATETTSPATIMPADHTRDNLDSVGLTVPCGDIRIMDDDGREVPPGETGEIWIAGPMVVPGYWNNPQATAREFTGGYWRSGDLGSKDARGFVRVFDRKKDMINRGGYKIFSVEVENLLMAQPGVLEAAVVGRPCPVLGERVHAVLTVEHPLDEAGLRQACEAALADYKVPETFDQRREPLPRNANGKVLKRELREAAVRAG